MFEALRLLANCYKHDLSSEPEDELLELLQLETGVNYLPPWQPSSGVGES